MVAPAVQLAAIVYHLASRLAYVLGVGSALGRQRRRPREGAPECEGRFARFRRWAAPIMANDAVSFVAACWWTRSGAVTDALGAPALVLGASLLLIGIFVKIWATIALGARAFYWYDFFCPRAEAGATLSGPYRFLRNPMYSLGYAHTYGVALLLGSLPGLLLAVFDQATMLVFHRRVELPHVESLYGTQRRGRLARGQSVPLETASGSGLAPSDRRQADPPPEAPAPPAKNV